MFYFYLPATLKLSSHLFMTVLLQSGFSLKHICQAGISSGEEIPTYELIHPCAHIHQKPEIKREAHCRVCGDSSCTVATSSFEALLCVNIVTSLSFLRLVGFICKLMRLKGHYVVFLKRNSNSKFLIFKILMM